VRAAHATSLIDRDELRDVNDRIFPQSRALSGERDIPGGVRQFEVRSHDRGKYGPNLAASEIV
jgi:hypothetical protein